MAIMVGGFSAFCSVEYKYIWNLNTGDYWFSTKFIGLESRCNMFGINRCNKKDIKIVFFGDSIQWASSEWLFR